MLYPHPIGRARDFRFSRRYGLFGDGLVDGLHLLMFPLTQGAGQQLFTDSGPAIKLALAG